MYYAAPDCAVTPAGKFAAERQDKRDSKCTATQIHGAVDGLSSVVLADRVTGEDSVDFDTDMIKSTSIRGSPDALAGGALPPRPQHTSLGAFV